MKPATPKIAVLIACHNRRDKTMECLDYLAVTASRAGISYQLYLFDDGSTDDTPDAMAELQARHPEIIRLLRQENAGLARIPGERHRG